MKFASVPAVVVFLAFFFLNAEDAVAEGATVSAVVGDGAFVDMSIAADVSASSACGWCCSLKYFSYTDNCPLGVSISCRCPPTVSLFLVVHMDARTSDVFPDILAMHAGKRGGCTVSTGSLCLHCCLNSSMLIFLDRSTHWSGAGKITGCLNPNSSLAMTASQLRLIGVLKDGLLICHALAHWKQQNVPNTRYVFLLSS